MLKKATLLALCLLTAGASLASAAVATGAAKAREFVIADTQQTVSLDPLHTYTSFESQFYTAIYEGLLVADPATLEPRPGVAQSWESSRDGKTWTFTLRPDARFSNGDRVRAQDFVATWFRMIDPANNAEYSFFFDVIKGARAYRTGAEKNAATVGLTAVSDTVLKVELETAAPHFLKMLMHISFLPLHPSLLKARGWAGAAAVIGNGPFIMTSRTDTEIVLEKNAQYWDAGRVGLDRIRIRFMEDPADATDGYITGRVNWVTRSLIAGDKLQAQDKLEASPMFGTTYFFFNCSQAPWSDWRVRRGLALLVPWDAVRSKDIFYYPSELVVPAVPNYPAVKGITAPKAEEALTLLADAGYPGGKGLPDLVVKLQKGSYLVGLAQKMADAWKSSLGLKVVMKEVDPETFLQQTRTYDYALSSSTWIGDYADPLTFLQLWTTGSNLNDARYSNPDYDTAVQEAISLLDPAKRYRRLADAEQLLLTQAAVLPLDHSPAISLINTDSVDGWFTNPLDVHPFKFLRFKSPASPPGLALALP